MKSTFQKLCLSLLMVVMVSTTLSISAQKQFTIKHQITYLGVGNSNEPLLSVLDDFDGRNQTTIKFKPVGSAVEAGKLTNFHVYDRLYPKDGSKFYDADKDIDFGIFYEGNPFLWGDVWYLGEATAEDDGEYSFTVNAPLSGWHYLVITADVATDAVEGTTAGAVLTEYNGATQESTITGEQCREVIRHRHSLFRPFDGYSNFYRLPTIITADDGRLVVTSDARKFHNHDTRNDMDVVSRYTTDNGATWSNPIIIAQGEGMTKNDDDCTASSVIGYSDAALSNLPTPGHVLAVFEKELPLSVQYADNSRRPEVCYAISTNNGVTWSEPKMIPSDLFSDSTGRQAIPSPGRMCLVKQGKLAGKVLGAFYTMKAVLRDFEVNFLTYDETTDSWATVGGIFNADKEALFGNSVSAAGESHFVEIGEDQFLLSTRLDVDWNITDKKRAWFTCSVNADNKIANLEHVESKFIDGVLPTTSGSNMVTYTGKDGKNYLVQAMVVGQGTYQNWEQGNTDGIPQYCRQNVMVKYADLTDLATTKKLDWKGGRTLSRGMATSGYSCLTVQADGTFGFVSEDYPVAYYYMTPDCSRTASKSDAFLGSIYNNFSIEWLTNDEVKNPINYTIEPPKILPGNTTFAVDGEGAMIDEAEKELFSNGKVWVEIEPTLNAGEKYYIDLVIGVTKANNQHISLQARKGSDNTKDVPVNFTKMIGYLQATDNKIGHLDQVDISARTVVCDAEGNVLRSSVFVNASYRAILEGRKVKLVAKVDGSVCDADAQILKLVDVAPSIAVNGAEATATLDGVPATQLVGVHQKVNLFGNGSKLAKFMGFSLNADGCVKDALSAADGAFKTNIVLDGTQQTIVVPSSDEYAGDEITIYAYYDVKGGGHYQRAYAKAHTLKDSPDGKWISDKSVNIIEEINTKADRENMRLDKPAKDSDNKGSGIQMFNSAQNDDQTITLKLAPDMVSVYYSAYVVLRKQDGSLLKGADGKVVCAHIAGINPGSVAAGAKRRAPLADADQTTVTELTWTDGKSPEFVEVTFPVGDKLNSTTASIETYVVANQAVTFDDAMDDALYVVKQKVESIQVPLGLDEVNGATESAFAVTALGGGEVMFESAEAIEVNVFDVAGMLVARFPLEGKQVKRLAPGFYIANGVKFAILN